MGTARLIIDLSGKSELPADIVVQGPNDYAHARACLYTCIEAQAGHDLAVVVRHPALRSWFDDLKSSPWVACEEYSPLRDLSESLHLPPPKGLTDDDVLALGLDILARTNPPASGTMGSWIIQHKLGTLWLDVPPPRATQFGDVVQSILSAALENPWLLGCVREHLGEWGKVDASPMVHLWRYLAPSPPQRARVLAGYAAVYRYPREHVKAWLGPDLWKDLDVLDLALLPDVGEWLRHLTPPPSLRNDLEREVRTFLKGKVEDGADIQHLLGYTTGKLSTEAAVLIMALIDRPQDLTPAIFDRLTAMASADDHVQLVRLRHRLPVQAPDPIPNEWGPDRAQDVFTWAEQHYLPWYRSVRYRGDHVDADPVCLSFVTWLQRAYPTLISQVADTILGVRDRLEEVVSAGRSVIWIIVDGIGLEWGETLAALCANRGMTVTNQALCLTVLPTVTHTAKPALLGGLPPAKRLMSSQWTSVAEYREIMERGRWGEAGVRVAAEWGSETLSSLVSSGEAAVWLYLVNQIDKSVTHDTMPFEERVRRVSVLCNDLITMARAAQDEALTRYGQRPAVIICADHGYTTPAAGAIHSRVTEGTVEGRCVALPDDEAPPAGWWLLDPPEQYGLIERYASAYGNRFPGDTSPQAATHGGANPEEAIIPYIECDGIAPQFVPPHVKSVGVLKLGVSHQTLTLTLTNPNPLPVDSVDVTLDGVTEPITVERLQRHGTVNVTETFTGTPQEPGDLTLYGSLRYAHPDGVRRQEAIAVVAEVEKPLQVTTAEQEAFEDMFDE